MLNTTQTFISKVIAINITVNWETLAIYSKAIKFEFMESQTLKGTEYLNKTNETVSDFNDSVKSGFAQKVHILKSTTTQR